ncbi:MAG: hypothetical protein IIB36_13735 [Gemmatimonadetes bacterium]|nr:hypothetical protein [Gemmatimonadota bacterium]
MEGSDSIVPAGGCGFRRAFWAGLALLGLALVYVASHQPSWPWFSLWLIALLGGLGILSLPKVRQALNLSWFAVTLLVLTGTSLFDLYLFFRVETHRQRSELFPGQRPRGEAGGIGPAGSAAASIIRPLCFDSTRA